MKSLLTEETKELLSGLVGKLAIRTYPTTKTRVGVMDRIIDIPVYDYIGDPVKIVEVTDTHVVIVSEPYLKGTNVSFARTILNPVFYDTNWVECPYIGKCDADGNPLGEDDTSSNKFFEDVAEDKKTTILQKSYNDNIGDKFEKIKWKILKKLSLQM